MTQNVDCAKLVRCTQLVTPRAWQRILLLGTFILIWIVFRSKKKEKQGKR